MAHPPRGKAPQLHRLAIWFFSILLGLLVFWLIGLVLEDIRTWPGPEYAKFQGRQFDQLFTRREAIKERISGIERNLELKRRRMETLQESTQALRSTMEQLLAIKKLSIEKQQETSQAEQEAFLTAEKQFLAKQQSFQELNTAVSELTVKLHDSQQELRQLENTINEEQAPVRAAYHEARQWHRYRTAAVELGFLIPLAVIALFLFLKARRNIYAPLTYAFALAVLVRVGMVLHEYFPSHLFKYVLIFVAIAIVLLILIHLVRMIAFPKKDWLIKRYREAYSRFLCPICDYPIRRGPMRFAFWTRRSLKKHGSLGDDAHAADEPYVCPSCGTRLFEECEQCHQTRHSLLPACEHCGNETGIGLVGEGE